MTEFAEGRYHLRVYGPNGFFREFIGSTEDPDVEIRVGYERSKVDAQRLSGNLEVKATSRDPGKSYTLEIQDNAYGGGTQKRILAPGGTAALTVDGERSFAWYDLSIRIAESGRFERKLAGRVESGQWGFSDPQIGRIKA